MVFLLLPHLLALLQFLLLLFEIKYLYLLVLLRRLIKGVDLVLLRIHDVRKLVVLAPVDEALMLVVLPVSYPLLAHLLLHDASADFQRVILLKYAIELLDLALGLHFKSRDLSRLSAVGRRLSHQILYAVFTIIDLVVIIHLILLPGNLVFRVQHAVSILLVGPSLLVTLQSYLILELFNMCSNRLLVTKLHKTLDMALLYLYRVEHVYVGINHRDFVPVFRLLLSVERCEILHFSHDVRRRVRELLHQWSI